MGALERLRTHDCATPEVEDKSTTHRWTCDCGASWRFVPFVYPGRTLGWCLGMRTRREPDNPQGFWWCVEMQQRWESV